MNPDKVAGLFAWSLLIFVLGTMIGSCTTSNTYQHQAIEHQAARFNPTTGYFEWIKKAEKDDSLIQK